MKGRSTIWPRPMHRASRKTEPNDWGGALVRGSSGFSSWLLVPLLTVWGGCVIPVAPEFQDPPAAVNVPPQLKSVNPPFGMLVTPGVFTIEITDQNVQDDLTVRWWLDFPPGHRIGIDMFVHHRDDKTPIDATITQTLDCTYGPFTDGEDPHRLFAWVSDRGFSADYSTPNVVKDDGFLTTALWLVHISCPASSP